MYLLFDGENGPNWDFPPFAGQPTVYVVASIPRAGSNLLCNALGATKLAGRPRDYFASDHMRDFAHRWGPLTMASYRDQLFKHRTSPNGIFGFKIHWFQFAEFFTRNGRVTFEPLLKPSLIVYMRRRDKLRQAISWVRALQTKRFTSNMASRGTTEYKRSNINALLRDIAEQETMWDHFFAEASVTTLVIEYEDFVHSYHDTIAHVVKGLNLTIPISKVPQPSLSRLADAETEDWVDRYRTESEPESI